MWIATVVLSFCMGVLAGYQLPLWLDAWSAYRRRKAFRLIVLQQYTTANEQQARQQSKSHS